MTRAGRTPSSAASSRPLQGSSPDESPQSRGQRPAPRPPRVVVGVDGSEDSKRALRWAASLAASTGATITAVTAWQIPIAVGVTYMPRDVNLALDAEKWLSESVDQVFDGHRPTDMQLVVKEGAAAKVLLTESKDALLLVVGSRGHGGFMGLLLGSVSAAVAEHATCPVLVVHGDQPPPEFTS